MRIELIKAFTKNPQEGNPAGVIFDADNLSQKEMIRISAELGYSESVFIVKPTSDDADFRFRFMTSTTEVDSCGHATLAGAYSIYLRESFENLKIETGAGFVTVFRNKDGSFMMKMARSELGVEEYDRKEIAGLLGIDEKSTLHFPIKTSSVGSPKLMIPISSLEVVRSIKPDFDAMIKFSMKHPVNGFYAFTNKL
jgi:PhzF family phenazine biosynthesis protein